MKSKIMQAIFGEYIWLVILVIFIISAYDIIKKISKVKDLKFKNDDNMMTKKEKLEEAERIINKRTSIVPGLGNQNPIDVPEENVEIDERDMPWKLKNAEDTNEDGEENY